LGFDPIGWISNCSNEVDFFSLEKSFEKIKHKSWGDLSWYDSFQYSGKSPDITRRIYNVNESISEDLKNKKIISLMRIHNEVAEDEQNLSHLLDNFYGKKPPKHQLKRVVLSTTSQFESQFGLVDYIDTHRGNKLGYTAVNISSGKLIDPDEEPDSMINTSIALSSAIENLLLLGCTSGFRILPIYDAPDEQLLDSIRTNNDKFAAKYNLLLDDYSSLKLGKLFYGATAYAHSTKELPTRYDLIQPGMVLILTDQFGSLTPLSIYTISQIGEMNSILSKHEPIDSSIKNEIIKSLTQPRFSLGKIISKYCADFGKEVDAKENIISVYPVGSEGILALVNLSRMSKAHFKVNEVPIKHEEMARFATDEFLVSNSTAAMNGCHLIVTSEDLAPLVLEELKKHNFNPQIIGFVNDKERPMVTINNNINKFVAAKHITSLFNISA
jgi:selenophosphate synthase